MPVSQNLVNRHLLPRLNPDWIYLSGIGFIQIVLEEVVKQV